MKQRGRCGKEEFVADGIEVLTCGLESFFGIFAKLGPLVEQAVYRWFRGFVVSWFPGSRRACQLRR